MNKLLRQAGLLASAAFVLTAGGSALAGEPAKKDGEPKVERKVVVIKDGVVVSGKDDGRPMPFRRHMDPAHRADHLRDMLQLRPDQEPALKAFLEATKPDIHKFEMKLDKDGKPADPPKMLTTPERLDHQARMMAEHQAAFQKRSAATRAFYGQLSPSQQKVFDTLHAHHGGGRHVKIFRRGGPGGHGDRMMLRHGGPEGGPPMPGGMAWEDLDVEEFAMLGDEDIDVRVIVDDEDVGPGDED
ncbi:MAG: hypothetical protein K0R83_103 [Caulobacter sp.]|jgi:hypothetical protein|nr:hypothetical protein [Caulobacter sp.]